MEKLGMPGNIIPLQRIRENRRPSIKPVNRTSAAKKTRIFAITSGKGGVGKTNIVANLGFALSKLGKQVLIFDADLGLGNLDVLLGITPKYNLSHVINGLKPIEDVIVEGPGQIKILPASSGMQELTRLSLDQRFGLLKALDGLIAQFDVMLIDTAAGISSNVLYFSVSAQEIMVVVTPEPTSITDAYALMKILSLKYKETHFKLIVNSVDSEHEAEEVSRQLSLVADRFLDISIEYFGAILCDANVKKGVMRQKVVSEMAPLTSASRSFSKLARKLCNSEPPEGCDKGGFFLHKEMLQKIAD
jgi:flagellar biosynthesis protein FlhG